MEMAEAFGGVIPGARGATLAALLRTRAPLTGRQVHRLVGGRSSLGAVQDALAAWVRLGVVDREAIGSAHVYRVNDEHVAVPALEVLVSPLLMLRDVASEFATAGLNCLLVFGSVARGDAAGGSDLDLAAIASPEWAHGPGVVEAVRRRLGTACDLVVLTPERYWQLLEQAEPVVLDIDRDGIAVIGAKPSRAAGAA